MNINKENYYQTSDISLATTLSLFYQLDSIYRQSDQKSFFIFKREKKLDETISKYWLGSLKIEPKDYFNQLKNIKTRLYSEK